MYARILVATDGSTLSKKAVADAIGLAATCGAELIALKVVPRYPQAYFEGSIPLNAKDVARIETQWSDEAQAAVDAVQKAATAKGIKAKFACVDFIFRYGRTPRSILSSFALPAGRQ